MGLFAWTFGWERSWIGTEKGLLLRGWTSKIRRKVIHVTILTYYVHGVEFFGRVMIVWCTLKLLAESLENSYLCSAFHLQNCNKMAQNCYVSNLRVKHLHGLESSKKQIKVYWNGLGACGVLLAILFTGNVEQSPPGFEWWRHVKCSFWLELCLSKILRQQKEHKKNRKVDVLQSGWIIELKPCMEYSYSRFSCGFWLSSCCCVVAWSPLCPYHEFFSVWENCACTAHQDNINHAC